MQAIVRVKGDILDLKVVSPAVEEVIRLEARTRLDDRLAVGGADPVRQPADASHGRRRGLAVLPARQHHHPDPGRQLRRHCVLDEEGRNLLKNAMEDLGLSARAHDRILRVARTIADLEGSSDIRPSHLSEAINYRSLDRKLWAR